MKSIQKSYLIALFLIVILTSSTYYFLMFFNHSFDDYKIKHIDIKNYDDDKISKALVKGGFDDLSATLFTSHIMSSINYQVKKSHIKGKFSELHYLKNALPIYIVEDSWVDSEVTDLAQRESKAGRADIIEKISIIRGNNIYLEGKFIIVTYNETKMKIFIGTPNW